jgi:membrane dipeptidase
MFVADAHCDSIALVDEGKYGIINPHNFSKKHPQLQLVAMFCGHPGEDSEQCYQRAVRYVGHFNIEMQKHSDKIVQVRTFSDIEKAFLDGKHAALLSIEGGTGIKGSPEILRDMYFAGVRVFGLAWLSNDLAKSNRIADGEQDTGLTEVGKSIVQEGNRLGMIFDVSHLSDKSFWDLAGIAKKPLMATHSNFRSLCSHSRNLTDDMAMELIRRGGFIGLNLCTAFISDEKPAQTVDTLFSHLDHALALGGENTIGFGCDIDGIGHYPAPLNEKESIHDQLIELMLKHNYPESLVEKVAYKNLLDYFKKNL